MGVAVMTRVMATRVVIRVDHVVWRWTDGWVDLLGGHRNVVRVERSLVVVRVAIIRVPARSSLSFNSLG